MARKTTVTHPDRTVSTRTSTTKHYTHAVEVAFDNHAEARKVRGHGLASAAKALQYRRALEEGFVHIKVTATGPGRESRCVSFFLIDTTTGEELYLGRELRNADGTFHEYSTGDELDVPTEALASAEISERAAEGYAERAEKIEALPQMRYIIERWSQSQQAAEKHAQSLRSKGINARVVQPDEA